MRVTMLEPRLLPEQLLEGGKSYTLDTDLASSLVAQGYATKGRRRVADEPDEPETEAEEQPAGDPASGDTIQEG